MMMMSGSAKLFLHKKMILPAALCMAAVTGSLAAPSLANPAHGAAHGAVQPCTIISGGNEALGGLKIYVSNNALRVQLLSGKTYLVARAPDWHVVVFNPTNNRGMSMPLQKWLDHTPQVVYWPVPDQHDHWVESSSSETTRLGNKCVKVTLYKTKGPAQPRYKSKDNEYILLDNPTANLAACHIVQTFLGVPPHKGIPLSFTCMVRIRSIKNTLAFQRHDILKTTKIERGSAPTQFFSYPTGFKHAKREVEIISDGDKKEQYENILGPLTAP
jgi:hypothetical protein